MSHVEQAKDKLLNKWFKEVVRLFSQENKKYYQDGFLNCTAELMTQQLQDLVINSIADYVGIFVNKKTDIKRYQHPGFIVRLQLSNDHITFSPTMHDFEEVLTSFVDTIVQAVMKIPRVETKMYTDYKANKQFLEPVIPQKIVTDAKNAIIQVLRNETNGPIQYISNFDDYMPLITNEAESEVTEALEVEEGGHLDFEPIMVLVNKYQDMNDDVQNNLEKICRVGMFDIVSDEFTHSLSKRADKLVTTLLGKAQEEHLSSMKSIVTEYQNIAEKAWKTPANTEELVELQEFIAKTQKDAMPEIRAKLLTGQKHMTSLLEQRTFVSSMMTPRDLRTNADAFTWHQRMPEIFAENAEIINQRTNQYKEALNHKKERFLEELETYQQKLEEFDSYNSADPGDINKYLKATQKLNSQLEQALNKIEQFNMEEESYGLEVTSYPQQRQIAKAVQPYLKLYETAANFHNQSKDWKEGNMADVNPDNVENEVAAYWRGLYKLEKQFANNPAAVKIAKSTKDCVDDFKEILPIVSAVCNQGLRKRHWEQMSTVVGFNLEPDENSNLQKYLQGGSLINVFLHLDTSGWMLADA